MIQTLERTEVFPLNQNRFMSGSSNPDLPRTWNMWYELFTRLFLLTFNKLNYLYISLHHPITCYTIGTKPNVNHVEPFLEQFQGLLYVSFHFPNFLCLKISPALKQTFLT